MNIAHFHFILLNYAFHFQPITRVLRRITDVPLADAFQFHGFAITSTIVETTPTKFTAVSQKNTLKNLLYTWICPV